MSRRKAPLRARRLPAHAAGTPSEERGPRWAPPDNLCNATDTDAEGLMLVNVHDLVAHSDAPVGHEHAFRQLVLFPLVKGVFQIRVPEIAWASETALAAAFAALPAVCGREMKAASPSNKTRPKRICGT
jgi:phytoene dehydrogenase-like protein